MVEDHRVSDFATVTFLRRIIVNFRCQLLSISLFLFQTRIRFVTLATKIYKNHGSYFVFAYKKQSCCLGMQNKIMFFLTIYHFWF